MARVLTRIGQEKFDMVVKIQFLSATKSDSSKVTNFSVDWKRGPNIDSSQAYDFAQSADGKVELTESYQRVSGFYQNKARKFQKKTAEFRLKAGKKEIGKYSFDLASQIGNKNAPLTVNFPKVGVDIQVQFEIIPACRIAHKELFDYEKILLGVKKGIVAKVDTVKNEDAGNDIGEFQLDSSVPAPARAEEDEEVVLGLDDQENLLNAVLELQQENDKMSVRLDELNTGKADPDGLVNNQVNVIKEVQLLVQKQAAEIAELKASKASYTEKAQKEIGYLLNLVQTGHAKVVKQEKSIAYLVDLVGSQSAKLVASETLIPRYKKELTYLLDRVTNQSETITENEAKMEKYKKEMAYLHDVLLSLTSKSDAQDTKLQKHGKELGYLTDILKAQTEESTSKDIKLAKYHDEVQYMHELFKNYKPDAAALETRNLQEIVGLKTRLDQQIGLLDESKATLTHLKAEKVLALAQWNAAQKIGHAFEDYV